LHYRAFGCALLFRFIAPLLQLQDSPRGICRFRRPTGRRSELRVAASAADQVPAPGPSVRCLGSFSICPVFGLTPLCCNALSVAALSRVSSTQHTTRAHLLSDCPSLRSHFVTACLVEHLLSINSLFLVFALQHANLRVGLLFDYIRCVSVFVQNRVVCPTVVLLLLARAVLSPLSHGSRAVARLHSRLQGAFSDAGILFAPVRSGHSRRVLSSACELVDYVPERGPIPAVSV
jgi:hypothetical protein